jgi:hypothetical protein
MSPDGDMPPCFSAVPSSAGVAVLFPAGGVTLRPGRVALLSSGLAWPPAVLDRAPALLGRLPVELVPLPVELVRLLVVRALLVPRPGLAAGGVSAAGGDAAA